MRRGRHAPARSGRAGTRPTVDATGAGAPGRRRRIPGTAGPAPPAPAPPARGAAGAWPTRTRPVGEFARAHAERAAESRTPLATATRASASGATPRRRAPELTADEPEAAAVPSGRPARRAPRRPRPGVGGPAQRSADAADGVGQAPRQHPRRARPARRARPHRRARRAARARRSSTSAGPRSIPTSSRSCPRRTRAGCGALPTHRDGSRIEVAVADPLDENLDTQLIELLGSLVRIKLAVHSDLEQAIDQLLRAVGRPRRRAPHVRSAPRGAQGGAGAGDAGADRRRRERAGRQGRQPDPRAGRARPRVRRAHRADGRHACASGSAPTARSTRS